MGTNIIALLDHISIKIGIWVAIALWVLWAGYYVRTEMIKQEKINNVVQFVQELQKINITNN